MVDPSAFAPADLVGAYSRGLQVHQQNEQAQGRKRLGDLLPQAAQGDQAAIREIAGIDPHLFMQLDERQKAQASAELDDLSAAVRWADTPEKWAQAQQFYASQGHEEVLEHPFESRESVLLQLGKMGDYMKGGPKAEYRTLEPGGSLIDVSGGNPRVVIAPNDGSYATGAPAQQGIPKVSDQQSYDAVPPGAQYMTPDGHVRVKQGGPSSQGSGGFPY